MKKYMLSYLKTFTVVLLTALACACTTFFDKDNTPKPAKLVYFKPEAYPKMLWYTGINSGVRRDYIKLSLAIDGNNIYAVDKTGYVTANSVNYGRSLWGTATPIDATTGGPAAGDGIVVIASRKGKIIALRELDGKPLWSTEVSSEVLAAPAISNHVVLIKTIDGKLSAFSTSDGRLLWNYEQTEPSLILRAASAPQIRGNFAIIGYANGNLAKLTLREGSLLWLQTVALPEGSFAIQRMVDIDADPIIVNNRVYVATFQGKIAALDLATGKPIWSNAVSSYAGIAADDKYIFVSDANSQLWAFDAATGSIAWRQTQLEGRNITGPVVVGNQVMVADGKGYLHWMSKQDGHFVARAHVNRWGIISNPIVQNGIIYVTTKDGHLAAYTLA